MDPNNSDKNNTPPTEVPTADVPANPVAPEAPATPEITPAVNPVVASAEEPVAAQSTPEGAPMAPETPTVETVAAEATPSPVSPEVTPEASPAPGATPAVNTTPEAEATPFTAGAPEPPKQSNTKKIILIAGIAAGALLIAIIGVVLYFIFTTVSREDYRAAATQFNEVSRGSTALNSEISSLSYSVSNSTDEEFSKDIQETRDAIATIKTENEELSKLKAVRVGEGAKLYGAFEDKLTPYLSHAESLVASVEKVRPAMVTCDAVSGFSDTAGRVSALKKCAEALGTVGDLPNPEFKTFVGELKGSYAEYAANYEAISALSDPYGDNYEQYKTLRDKMYDVQDKIGDASDTFSDNIEKRDDELSVKPSAEALADYLTEQQRQ